MVQTEGKWKFSIDCIITTYKYEYFFQHHPLQFNACEFLHVVIGHTDPRSYNPMYNVQNGILLTLNSCYLFQCSQSKWLRTGYNPCTNSRWNSNTEHWITVIITRFTHCIHKIITYHFCFMCSTNVGCWTMNKSFCNTKIFHEQSGWLIWIELKIVLDALDTFWAVVFTVYDWAVNSEQCAGTL